MNPAYDSDPDLLRLRFAICADPKDILLRHAYADRAEEIGHPMTQFIRAQLANPSSEYQFARNKNVSRPGQIDDYDDGLSRMDRAYQCGMVGQVTFTLHGKPGRFSFNSILQDPVWKYHPIVKIRGMHYDVFLHPPEEVFVNSLPTLKPAWEEEIATGPRGVDWDSLVDAARRAHGWPALQR